MHLKNGWLEDVTYFPAKPFGSWYMFHGKNDVSLDSAVLVTERSSKNGAQVNPKNYCIFHCEDMLILARQVRETLVLLLLLLLLLYL